MAMVQDLGMVAVMAAVVVVLGGGEAVEEVAVVELL
jgi:hypothetical protein